jgi:methyl-accepting chemotaxis protein
MERTRINSVSKMRQLESELAALSVESETLEREILVKKKTLEMAPAALENICRLQEVCGTLSGRLLQLAQEWEAHRRPLVDLLKAKKRDKTLRRVRCRQMADETKRLREEMGAMAADLKDKQERTQILAQEVEDLPKNLTRAVYTSRILDIITSLSKQNVEIEKITTDIHDIQKSINTTTSALQRADAVAEDLIYTAASTANADKAVVDTYRRLKNMRAKFEELIDTVTKIGQQEKMARDLENKIDVETGRMSSNNITQIGQDLLEIQAENDGLIARIKELTR